MNTDYGVWMAQDSTFENAGVFELPLNSWVVIGTDSASEFMNSGIVRKDVSTSTYSAFFNVAVLTNSGLIDVTSGTLSLNGWVEGAFVGTPQIFNTGTILGASGTTLNVVGSLHNGGVIHGDHVALQLSSLSEAIGGISPGAEYGAIVANTLLPVSGSLTIQLTNNFRPSLGESFVVIDKVSPGPIVGTFSGLNEGDYLWSGDYGFQISYVGGDGNDVVLTMNQVAYVYWDGDAGDFQWSNPLNWGTDVLPGVNDDVVIDLGTNNFTVIHSIGTDSIKSLTSHAGLNVSGGQLLVTEDSELFSVLTVGGTFGGSGDVTVDGLFQLTGGTLSGVAGQGSLTANGGTAITGAANQQGGFRFVNAVGSNAIWNSTARFF